MGQQPFVEVEAGYLRFYRRDDFFSRLPTSVSTGFIFYAVFSLSVGTVALPISIVATAPLVLLTLYRNRILRKVVKLGFVSTFRFRGIVEVLFWSGMTLTLGGSILSFYPLTTKYLYLGLGSGLTLISVSSNWNNFMAPWAVGKLSIEQFLMENKQENANYSWLRRGLRNVENRLRRLGVSPPRGSLFLGTSYAILKKEPIEQDLMLLAEWVGRPKTETKMDILRPVARFLTQAQEAETAGFKPAPTLTDYLGDLPWQKISYATGSLAVVVGVIAALLRFFA